jgi:hypothetical protein
MVTGAVTTNMEVKIPWSFDAEFLQTSNVITASRLIRFVGQVWGQRGLQYIPDITNYYVENVSEGMTQPGQFYWDKTQQKVIYYPIGGKDPNTSTIIVPTTSRMWEIFGYTGTVGTFGTAPHDVTFSNLNMRVLAAPVELEGGMGYLQDYASDISFTPNCGAGNITIQNCKLGWGCGNGIGADFAGLTNFFLRDSEIGFTGGYGVSVKASSIGGGRVVISNNYIHDGALLTDQAPGINVSTNATVIRNRVWNWTEAGIADQSGVDGCLFVQNDVSNCMQRNEDMGAYYQYRAGVTAPAVGNLIQSNFFQFIGGGAINSTGADPRNFYRPAIYLDEQSSNTVVDHNMTLGCPMVGLMNIAHSNAWQNNVFLPAPTNANWPYGLRLYVSSDTTLPELFTGNLLLSLGGFLFDNSNNVSSFANNVAYSIPGQTNGIPSGATITNTLYTNRIYGAFEFLPNDPTRRLPFGYQALYLIPNTNAGVYGVSGVLPQQFVGGVPAERVPGPEDNQTPWMPGYVGLPNGNTIPALPTGTNVINFLTQSLSLWGSQVYGDGVHDDYIAISNGFRWMGKWTSNGIPGVAYFPAPPGTPGVAGTTNYLTTHGYTIGSQITILGDDVDGTNLTVLCRSNSTTAGGLFTFSHSSGTLLNNPITNGLFKGSTWIATSNTPPSIGQFAQISGLNPTNLVNTNTYTFSQIVPVGAVYSAAIGSGPYATNGSYGVTGLDPGTQYFTFAGTSGHDFQMVNGTQIFSNMAGLFVPQGTTVTLYGTPGATVLRQLGPDAGCNYCGDGHGQYCLGQIVLITNVIGNNVYFTPPLDNGILWDQSLHPKLEDIPMLTNAGAMNITVMQQTPFNSQGVQNISFSGCAWCYLSNVTSLNCSGQHVKISTTFGMYICHNFIHDNPYYTSGEGYGIWPENYNTGFDIEDNVLHNMRHSIPTEAGATWYFIGYNFCTNVIAGEDPTDFLSGDLLNHGAHAIHGLYEGNDAVNSRGDFAHGSSSHRVDFRNHFRVQSYCEPQIGAPGYVINNGGFWAFMYSWFQYSNSAVGNVVDVSLLQAATGAAQPALYQLGPQGLQGTNQNVPGVYAFGMLNVSWSSTEMPEDQKTAQTFWAHMNYDPVTGTIVANTNCPTTTIPASLRYGSVAPPWWPAAKRWPPIGSDMSPKVVSLPAIDRFYAQTNSIAIITGGAVFIMWH